MTADELKAEIAVEFAALRQIEWDRMREGVERVAQVLAAFHNRVEAHLKTI